METSPQTTEPVPSVQSRTPLDQVAVAVATAGGAGFVPKLPGTIGSLVGVGLYLAIDFFGWYSLYLPILGAISIVGIWSANHVEGIYGHDASKIIVDEVIGQMITLGFVIRSGTSSVLTAAILGFLLFRFFDILKPFPLRRLEQLPGGFGVVADDVGAGVYGLIALTLIESLVIS